MHRLHRAVINELINMVEYHPATCGISHASLSPSRLTTNDTLNRQNIVFGYVVSALSLLFKIQHGTNEGKISRCSMEKQFHAPPTDKIRLTQYKLLSCPFKLFCSSVCVCFLVTKENEGGTNHHQSSHNFNQQIRHPNIHLQGEIKLMKLTFSVSCLLNQPHIWYKLDGDRKHKSSIRRYTTCYRQADTIGIQYTIGTSASPLQPCLSLHYGENTCRTSQAEKGNMQFASKDTQLVIG
jgi:cyclophilin family peptidyl-prolyl cis-trans isomerase